MAFAKKPAPPPTPPTAATTSASSDIPLMRESEAAVPLPPTEIQLLADDLVAVVRTSTYDDMPWPEIDAALQLASHNIKVIIAQHGTLDPSPEDNVPAPPPA